MDYSEMLQRAIEIAVKAHAGQVDRAGQPYILHPLRVMNMGETMEEKIVGVLHDVIEDSKMSFDDLLTEGFTEDLIDALWCVTKLSDDELYDAFIERVKTNSLAIKVKMNDLTDNMDIRRLATLQEKDFERLRKYVAAYQELKPLAGK